jgi:tRNA(fMet)-specific endonuclease VapC
VVERVLALPDTDVATTVVTAEEQLKGWLNVVHRASEDRLVFTYSLFQENLEYFKTIRLLPFDEAALGRYKEIRRQKLRVGTKDLRIAAVTLANKATLVTRNARDFSRVPGLKYEDWAILDR